MNFEEAANWTVMEVRRQIGLSLPTGWSLVDGAGEELPLLLIKDSHGIVRWQDAHPDERHLLLCAFGWIEAQKKRPTNPFWGPRRELTPDVVRRNAIFKSANVPDPGDVTPEEVQSLYAKHGR